MAPFPSDTYNILRFNSSIKINGTASNPENYVLSFWLWQYETPSAERSSITIRCNLFSSVDDIDYYFRDINPVQYSTPQYYEIPFTVNFAGTVSLRFVTQTKWTAGNVFFSDVKLEKGTKATAWNYAPDEFNAGSNVVMTKDKVYIGTPEFEVNISNSEEDFHLDENGGSFNNLSVQKLTAPIKQGDVICQAKVMMEGGEA